MTPYAARALGETMDLPDDIILRLLSLGGGLGILLISLLRLRWDWILSLLQRLASGLHLGISGGTWWLAGRRLAKAFQTAAAQLAQAIPDISPLSITIRRLRPGEEPVSGSRQEPDLWMDPSADRVESTAHLALAYVREAFWPRLRPYCHNYLVQAIDLTIAEHILLAAGRLAARDWLRRSMIEPAMSQPETSPVMDGVQRLHELGLLAPLLLQELASTIVPLLSEKQPGPALRQETLHFAVFLIEAILAPPQMPPTFSGRHFRCSLYIMREYGDNGSNPQSRYRRHLASACEYMGMNTLIMLGYGPGGMRGVNNLAAWAKQQRLAQDCQNRPLTIVFDEDNHAPHRLLRCLFNRRPLNKRQEHLENTVRQMLPAIANNIWITSVMLSRCGQGVLLLRDTTPAASHSASDIDWIQIQNRLQDSFGRPVHLCWWHIEPRKMIAQIVGPPLSPKDIQFTSAGDTVTITTRDAASRFQLLVSAGWRLHLAEIITGFQIEVTSAKGMGPPWDLLNISSLLASHIPGFSEQWQVAGFAIEEDYLLAGLAELENSSCPTKANLPPSTELAPRLCLNTGLRQAAVIPFLEDDPAETVRSALLALAGVQPIQVSFRDGICHVLTTPTEVSQLAGPDQIHLRLVANLIGREVIANAIGNIA